jgi:hypothetical protein
MALKCSANVSLVNSNVVARQVKSAMQAELRISFFTGKAACRWARRTNMNTSSAAERPPSRPISSRKMKAIAAGVSSRSTAVVNSRASRASKRPNFCNRSSSPDKRPSCWRQSWHKGTSIDLAIRPIRFFRPIQSVAGWAQCTHRPGKRTACSALTLSLTHWLIVMLVSGEYRAVSSVRYPAILMTDDTLIITLGKGDSKTSQCVTT